MRVHEFHSSTGGDVCEDVTAGQRCGEPRDARVHQYIAKTWCSPELKVELVVGRALPGGGIHFATLAYQPEDDGSWYSAWFAPHNEPNRFYRAQQFDCTHAVHVASVVQMAMEGLYTEATLLEMGLTNQYIPKVKGA